MGKIHIILFLGTLVTTFAAGFLQGGNIISGVSFSLTLLFILGSHEMGHYVYGKKYGVNISLPYFIPAPPFISPIGTFGAFIKINSPISTKKALFDIGIAGPIAGIVAAIPAIIIGMKLSEVVSTTSKDLQEGITLGSPLIFSFFSDRIFGTIPEGQDLLLHPVAFAGWIGLFVTALNLIPAAQLDGGHIIYALFPRRWYSRISVTVTVLLLFLGVGTAPIIRAFDLPGLEAYLKSISDILVFDGWAGWIMWAVLLSFMGMRHPPTMHDEVPLGIKRKLLGVLALLMLIGCFCPVPLKI